jgi:hypothetical protein
MDMNETRDRIFPDELDTRIDIGNFETSSSARKASRQEKRDRRKVLEQKCKSLEDELREETVRTQAIQQQLSTKRTPTVTPPLSRPYTPAYSDAGMAPALSPTTKVGVPFYQ